MKNHPWHSYSPAEVLGMVNTNATRGLSDEQIESQRKHYGSNTLDTIRRQNFLIRIISRLKNPIELVLISAGIAAFLLTQYVDAVVIFFALVVNIIVGFVQEGRANSAFETLQKGEEKFAFVIRSGRRIKISANDLVVGDIVLLESGHSVPADIRLIQTTDVATNEATLTGEWIEVEKKAETLEEDTPLARRENMVFRGTTMVRGTGKGVVVSVGVESEVGTIAHELQHDVRPKTPLEKNMEEVARFILFIVLFFALLILALGVWRGEPLTEMVLIAIAIAVAAIPEGLPAAVTVSLALGMERILKYGGLVRNLLAAETLGTTTIILTDKTGTLTQGQMTLVEYATISERTKETDSPEIESLLSAAVTSSDAIIEEDKESGEVQVHGRPIEKAIMLAGVTASITASSLVRIEHILRLPFSSTRRYGGVVTENIENNATELYVAGAPEFLLARSTEVIDGEETRVLTPADQTKIERYLEEYASNGLRVIGVAHKALSSDEVHALKADSSTQIQNFVFAGLLVFADGIREDVPAAIERITYAGARVVMVTGDNPNTAHYIATQVGISTPGEKTYVGSDIDRMNDRELLHALKTHHVFARVLPVQKLRIARVLQSADEVVAMTGDGINDAPALQSATIGIAVGSGTDVAKEASDLVLLNNSFSIIVHAIEEGRRLRENIKKIISFLLATNFSGTFIVASALVLALPLPVLPTQVLWANIVGGGLMNFAFAFEPKDPASLARGPRHPDTLHILSKNVIRLILLVGLITGGILLGLYVYLLSQDLAIEHIRTLLFVALSFDAFFFAFSMKSFTDPIWRVHIFSNVYLLIALGISFLVLLSALSVPAISFLLSVTPLTFADIGLLIILAFANVITIEIAKAIFFHDLTPRKIS